MLLCGAISIGGPGAAMAAAPAETTVASPRGAAAAPAAPSARGERPLRFAEADCSAAAAEAAAETGGQVLSVSSREQGGQTVCVVTLLVPGDGGGRPRKQTITVPQ